MVHTATLTYRVSAEMLDRFKKISRYNSEKKHWFNEDYKDRGIKLYAKICFSGGYSAGFLFCVVNFHKLLNDNDHITVYRNGNYSEVQRLFNQIMDELGGLPWLEEWNAARVDYCYNARTPHVATYIRLMQKGKKKHNLQQAKDKKTGRRKAREGSVYLVSKARENGRTGSVTINFYDKYDQCKKRGKPQEILEQARDILRFEIQCYAPKLDRFKRKDGLPDRRIITLLQHPELSIETVKYYVKDLAIDADYQRIAQAYIIIANTDRKIDTKKRMWSAIEALSKDGATVDKAIDTGLMQTNDIERFVSANVNPVTIPEKETLPGLGKNEGLLSAYKLFLTAFEDEMHMDDSDIEDYSIEDVEPYLDEIEEYQN